MGYAPEPPSRPGFIFVYAIVACIVYATVAVIVLSLR